MRCPYVSSVNAAEWRPTSAAGARAQTGLDQQRRARVTQRMKADAGQASALSRGNQDPTAQVALIRRSAFATGKHERILGDVTRSMGTQQGGKLGSQWDQPRTVPRLRRDDRAPDDRAPDMQMRGLTVEHEVAPAQAGRLGDAQPVAASNSNNGRHFDGTSSSSLTSSARVR